MWRSRPPPAVPRSIAFSGPTVLPLLSDWNSLSLRVLGADVWVQFGDDTLTAATFSTNLALYYPIASTFSVEPLRPPRGATRVAFMPVQPGAIVGRHTSDATVAYGGTRQKAVWGAGDRTVTLPLKTSITSLASPVTIIARVLSSNAGTDRTFAALVEASDADNNPRICLRVNAGNTWGAHYFNSGATSTGAITMTEDVWTTVVAKFTLNGANVDPSCWAYDDTSGSSSVVTAAGAVAFAGTYTRLVIGGLVNATGSQALSTNDALTEVMVYVGALTDAQRHQFAEKDCPPWDVIIPDPTGIYCWAEISGGVIRDRVTGESSTDRLTTGAALTFATYDGDTIRRHNRLATQDATGTLNVSYSNVASGEQALPAMSSCVWRAQAHHTVRYDMSTGTADATLAGYATLAAGVGLVYGQGGDVDIDVINDSGSASDTGVLDLTGVSYGQDLYVPQTSGLTATSNNGTVDYTSTGRNGANYRFTKPTTGSNWPLVVWAVGAGGLHTEYEDIAVLLAQHGYASVRLAFLDQGESSPWASFDYPKRIKEYREFIEDHLNAELLYQPSQVILIGHSGGCGTAEPCAGLRWTDTTGAPVVHNDGVVVPDGNGSVLGIVLLSGQKEQTTIRNMTTVVTDWLNVAIPVVRMTGTLDTGGLGGESYLDRLTAYGYLPSSLAAVKMAGLYWHHLYGGAFDDAALSDKMYLYNQRKLVENVILASCDYFRGVSLARRRLQHGWDDNQLTNASAVYEVKNL